MKNPILPLLVAGLVVSCTEDAPTALEQLAPGFAVAGSSGCYTVSGEIAQSGLAPSFSGTISGDIEGDVSTQLDPASTRAAGRVRITSADHTWQVTGGNVSELIGRTVRLTLQSEVVFAQPPVGRVNTRATVIEGAQAGNLTYHGTLDASPPPPTAVNVQYHGVVCP